MVTTDKVYANKEWVHGYRENDRLGGHDPYSANKAATEIAINSWRSSFCGGRRRQNPYPWQWHPLELKRSRGWRLG